MSPALHACGRASAFRTHCYPKQVSVITPLTSSFITRMLTRLIDEPSRMRDMIAAQPISEELITASKHDAKMN